LDKRTLLAFILCGILTALYVWHLKATQQRRERQAPQQQQPAEQEPRITPETPAGHEPEVAETAPAEKPEPETREPLRDVIRFPTPGLKYNAAFTNRGACLQRARLVEFQQELGSEDGFLLLSGVEDGPYYSLALKDPKGLLPLDTQHYEVVEESEQRIVFTSKFAGGLRVTKEFIPRPDAYAMGAKITFKNEGASEQRVRYEILAAARVLPEGSSNVFLTGAIGYLQESGRVKVEDKTPQKVRKGPLKITAREEAPVLWAGASNRYFAAALLPTAPKGGTVFDFIESGSIAFLPESDSIQGRAGRSKRVDNLYTALHVKEKGLPPGEEIVHEYTYFLGPKKGDVLAVYPDISGLLDYGLFGSISKLLLSLLHLFRRLIPNYGIGIILLTILVKACLHPLARKGQVSMHKMQKLQPLIRELQEKYKNDKQRLSREQMELFRKHGANPMTGCMPMIFQLPVFFGLFRMLQKSVDLRHEGFLLWIRDLSRPDTIATVGGFPINILPVLMVVSWMFQQSTMPKPADPQQAQTQKIMKFMPIMFGFMLYSMASGLTLYWLTSTFLGILEQKLIKMELAKMEERGDLPDVAAEQAQKGPQRGRGKRK